VLELPIPEVAEAAELLLDSLVAEVTLLAAMVVLVLLSFVMRPKTRGIIK
jgi:hypothetical protein